MDSINKRQVEHNMENLSGADAVDKVRELVKKANSCFFCTYVDRGPSNGARPMGVQEVDDDGNIWFLSANDSHKNQEIQENSSVTLYFQGSAHSDFMMLNGHASISEDRDRIEKYWEPVLKTWFTEGKDDPRISVIKFEPSEGYYWDTKHGNFVAGIKMMIGAALAKTMDDSIEGKLRV